jgi:hypothetical protein
MKFHPLRTATAVALFLGATAAWAASSACDDDSA